MQTEQAGERPGCCYGVIVKALVQFGKLEIVISVTD